MKKVLAIIAIAIVLTGCGSQYQACSGVNNWSQKGCSR